MYRIDSKYLESGVIICVVQIRKRLADDGLPQMSLSSTVPSLLDTLI